MPSTDTIIALATPPGKSGVAVIRISGARVCDALAALSCPLPPARTAHLTPLLCPDTQTIIDRAVVIFFKAPASFTGEDVIELQVHGSRAITSRLLALLSALPGFRLAEAGEFSRRALMNGKMDLLEVEALADLIDAETEAQRVQALRQMEGVTGKQFESLRAAIIEALALLEAYIDFPDEDIPTQVMQDVEQRVNNIHEQIMSMLDDKGIGERIREGFHIAIIGEPNVGKSSLLNLLARREAAIVSEIAGTTRDVIEVQMDIGGWPVIISDTAGLRESVDVIENIGIERARSRADEADIRIIMYDTAEREKADQSKYITGIIARESDIVVFNKADLNPNISIDQHAITLSAKTGQGMDALIETIKTRLDRAEGASSPCITRLRHRQALEQSATHLEQFDLTKELEIACEELRLAARRIGEITGKILVDELLDHIFSTFCIGK